MSETTTITLVTKDGEKSRTFKTIQGAQNYALRNSKPGVWVYETFCGVTVCVNKGFELVTQEAMQ